jgi:glycosyltransferase involved in cell wall biosynthesis
MKKRLLFVSPRFLFPADSGGAIRTGQILRGMKGGAFEITLVSPMPPGGDRDHAPALAGICDRFRGWPALDRSGLFPITRMRHITARLPITVVEDNAPAGRAIVAEELAAGPDIVVVDFAHAAVLIPERIDCRSLLFTHNVESEILARHARIARNPVHRLIWANQHRKMEIFERHALNRFDAAVAVAERDRDFFRDQFGAARVRVIPTGVDTGYFDYAPPTDAPVVAFVGSMDSMANIDGVSYFLDDIWPLIAHEIPQARMRVIGRNPPPAIAARARAKGYHWEVTGSVDDVRPHARGAAVHVVPLRVGGGTRIKVYEALAMGGPTVSTTIGVEGLTLTPKEHYLRADDPRSFAEAVVRLLRDEALRLRLSRQGRAHVEANFASAAVARIFEEICLEMVSDARRECA